MRRLSFRGDPTQEQEESWSPDELIDVLSDVKDKPIGKVYKTSLVLIKTISREFH